MHLGTDLGLTDIGILNQVAGHGGVSENWALVTSSGAHQGTLPYALPNSVGNRYKIVYNGYGGPWMILKSYDSIESGDGFPGGGGYVLDNIDEQAIFVDTNNYCEVASDAVPYSIYYLPASSFAPTDFDGSILWLDATKITGLSDGDIMETWADESGESNDVIQSNASLRPTYKTNIKNYKPAVYFPGSLKYFNTSIPSPTTGYTIFAVTKQTSRHNVNGIITYNRGTNFGLFHEQGENKISNAHRGQEAKKYSVTWDAWNQSTGMWTGTQNSVWVNGVAGQSLANTAVPASGTINGWIGVTHDNQAYWYFRGYMAEIIIYNRALSDADRGTVQTYLDDKWGAW